MCVCAVAHTHIYPPMHQKRFVAGAFTALAASTSSADVVRCPARNVDSLRSPPFSCVTKARGSLPWPSLRHLWHPAQVACSSSSECCIGCFCEAGCRVNQPYRHTLTLTLIHTRTHTHTYIYIYIYMYIHIYIYIHTECGFAGTFAGVSLLAGCG